MAMVERRGRLCCDDSGCIGRPFFLPSPLFHLPPLCSQPTAPSYGGGGYGGGGYGGGGYGGFSEYDTEDLFSSFNRQRGGGGFGARR